MVPETEKARVTEVRVRMDCNGCVHKIKKALSGITGICDLYIDLPQQKITIIGWADPAEIVKAIKKTRKTAIICLHTEQPVQETETEEKKEETSPEGGPEPTNSASEQQAPLSPPDSPPPHEETPPQEPANERETTKPFKPKEAEEIHVIHHYPPNYGHQYAYNQGGNRPMPNDYPQPVYATHSYNTYKPSPYVTEYTYPQSIPTYSNYSRPDHYREDYYGGSSSSGSGNSNGNGNITSMFSEENPNACRIV